MLATKLLSAMAGGEETLYVDDVFSAYTYTGNGSTQTINNGIDLAGKGGMVWIKTRAASYGNLLADTARGTGEYLKSETTGANQASADRITAFNSNGFSLGTNTATNSALDFASWTFRKAPKFFDVVTYTGNGGTKVVPHSLGSAPGMIVVKRTDTTGDWVVYHQSVPANCGFLNYTNSFASAQRFSSVTSSDFTINVSTADVNASGGTYVAYLFAHDTGTDGLIQCGSYTGAYPSSVSVTLGWEPQFFLVKNTTRASDWFIYDTARGLSYSTTDFSLAPNSSAAENGASGASDLGEPNATGIKITSGLTAANVSGDTHIYLAIRRPNKPPTTGTQVYNASAFTGADTLTNAGFPPDFVFYREREVAFSCWAMARLTAKYSQTDSTAIETSDGNTKWDAQNQFRASGDGNSRQRIYEFFRRAPGVFDVVCYTGVGVSQTVAHGLGVPPELILVKHRTIGYDWYVYAAGLGNTKHLLLNSGAATQIDATAWNNTNPTSSLFSLGTSPNVNDGGASLVAYLFATKAGISKVGSYTGNGSSQTIDCGFTTGSRFILIKRTDATGDWYVWDTVRGIIAGNDPHLSLNTTTAEVTSDDSIDPDTSGFIVNQLAATNINVNAASYIFLAFA